MNKKSTHIKNIIQLGDIHILKNNLHDVYQKDFSRFVVNLKKTFKNVSYDNLAIVVTGDVYNNYTDVTANAINCIAHMLLKLSEVAPVYLIEGNHDVNQKNLNQISVLELVVNLLDNENIFLLKNEPVEFENLFLIPYYVKENNIRPLDKNGNDLISVLKKKSPSKKRYGVFHGAISGANSYRESVVDNHNLPKSNVLFKDLDVVLMGDIHIPQSISDENTICVYNGSFFQRKSESYKKHGYVKWDVSNNNFTFKDFNSTIKYININISSFEDINLNEEYVINTYPDDKYNIPINQNYIYKLIWTDYSSNISLSKKKQLKIQFSKKWGIPLENIFVTTEYIYQGVNLNNIGSSLFKKTTNVKTVESTYKKYLKNHYFEITNPEIDEFLEFNKKIEKELNVQYTVNKERRRYEIQWVGGDNFLSFGEFEFKLNDKLTVITSEQGNMVGKSNLVRAISFALYGTIYYDGDESKSTFKEIFNIFSNKDYVNAQAIIKIDNNKFLLSRKLRRKLKEDGEWDIKHTFDVFLFTNEKDAEYFLHKKNTLYKVSSNGTLPVVKLTKSKNSETLQFISNEIGNVTDFYFSSVFTTDNVKKWLGFKPTERLKTFYRYLGLEVLEEKYAYVKQMYNEFSKKSLLHKYDKIDIQNQLKQNNSDIQEYEKKLNNVKKNITKFKEDIQLVNDNIENSKNQKQNIEIIDINTVKQELAKLKETQNNLEEENKKFLSKLKINSLSDKLINKVEAKIDEFQSLRFKPNLELIEKLKEVELKLQNIEESPELSTILKNKEQELIKARNKIVEYDNTLSILKEEYNELKSDIVCNNCNSIVINIEEEKKKIKERAKNLKSDKEHAKIVVDNIQLKIEEIKDKINKDKNNKKEKLLSLKVQYNNENNEQKERFENEKQAKINKYSRILRQINNHNIRIEKLLTLNTNIDILNEKIKKYNSTQLIKERNEELNNEIEKYNKTLKFLQNSLANKIEEKLQLEFSLKTTKEKLNENTDILTCIEKDIKQDLLYKRYLEVHDKKALPSQIITEVIPKLNEQLKEFLYSDDLELLTDFEISIELNNADLNFILKRDGKIINMKNGSGFEGTIATITLHAVFMLISNLPMNNILTLDEIFGTVNNVNLEKLHLIFQKLQPIYGNIILISHNKNITKLIENKIEILKTSNNISKIITNAND